MHHNQKQNSSVSPKPKRSVQPKSGAWSVQKSSLVRLGPESLLRSAKFLRRVEGPTATASSGTSVKKGKALRKSEKPIPAMVLGRMKANLEEDTNQFSSRLKEILPTVKSLSHSRRVTGGKTRSKAPTTGPNEQAVVPFHSQNFDVGLNLITPSPMGEKLITVGGYIISLQSTREDITSVVKPRVSTDKEGLEVEVKIVGCPPSEIRFEKRYDTLIVIGVANNPLPMTPISRRSTFHGEEGKGIASSHGKELVKSKGVAVSKANANLHPVGPSTATVPIVGDSLDEITEVVNIFVPKNISINQIFISSPDAKGRIFVKGP